MSVLSTQQRKQFKRQGFLVVRDAIDRDLCARALDTIWESVPEDRDDPDSWPGEELDSTGIEGLESAAPFEEIAREVFSYAEALVGKGLLAPPGEPPLDYCHHAGMLVPPEDHDGMLAPHISYPVEGLDQTDRATTAQGGHVDGYHGRFGPEELQYLPFTVAATVYVDEVSPCGGGFTVWPGSHEVFGDYFESNTYLDYIEADGVHEELDLGPPFEVTGSPGTLTLWHPNLVHAAGANLSRDVRMAAIGRFLRADIEEFDAEAILAEGVGLENVWSQFDALRDLDVERLDAHT